MTGKDTYDQVVSYAPGESRLAELAALIQLGLGRPLDPPIFSALADIQVELWDSQQSLAALLLARKLSQEDYLEKLNSAIRASMKKSATLLGKKRFKAIFGDAGWNPDGLTDRSTFLAHPLAGLNPE